MSDVRKIFWSNLNFNFPEYLFPMPSKNLTFYG